MRYDDCERHYGEELRESAQEKAQRIVGRRIAALGMARRGTVESSKRGSGKSKDCAPLTAGDDNDVEMDRPTVKDGDMDSCIQQALSRSRKMKSCVNTWD